MLVLMARLILYVSHTPSHFPLLTLTRFLCIFANHTHLYVYTQTMIWLEDIDHVINQFKLFVLLLFQLKIANVSISHNSMIVRRRVLRSDSPYHIVSYALLLNSSDLLLLPYALILTSNKRTRVVYCKVIVYCTVVCVYMLIYKLTL